MGSAQSATTVSVIADGEEPGPFATRRCPGYSSGPYMLPPEYQTMQDIILHSYKEFPDHPYLGRREKGPDGTLNKFYTFKTYKECETIAYNFGSGLIAGPGIQPQGFVGIYAENRTEWVNMIDVSCLYGHVIVSLYDTLSKDVIGTLIKHSKMTCLIVSASKSPKLLDILQNDKHELKTIIFLPDDGVPYDDIQSQYESLQLNFYTFDQICEIGSQNRQPLPKVEPEWIHYVCYSSGTTGVPKGVIISHRSQASNTLDCYLSLHFQDVETHHLSYLPLPHVFERIGISITSFVGGRIGFFSGSIARLVEDMQILKPTHLSAVPRVINRIYDSVQQQLQSSVVKKTLFYGLFYWKRFWLQRGYTTPLADRLVFNNINKTVGGEIRQFIVGGAAMDPWIHEFMQFATGIPMRVGYGLTEIGSGNICNPMDVRYSKPGTVGGPLPNSEVRLDPIEDYDDPTCGEILMGGQANCSGYLYDEEATARLFADPEKHWIHTGDVAKWDEDGYLVLVDRMRSIFKLAQGEYIAAELLSSMFEGAQIVSQIFIYGDSSRSSLVAIVVPDKQQVAKFLGLESISDQQYVNACNSNELKNEVLRQLDVIAVTKNLPGYEKIRAVDCVPDEWTIANDLLTPTFKLKRKKLAEKYKDKIEELYNSINH
ncbi:AMP-binding enzyme family protein [Histomonas meleagridis]|uniref:AMP-binding enzyme family protein n=1 Tax=Histomonas meleagridis TaxID=135588 RepID=UPI003559B693|nr:AMP-binding enzyme family protein [Histomonas meleagridis]KAH0802523.1 AMP-binding enzyme family protein [Histomonas meleagridis]